MSKEKNKLKEQIEQYRVSLDESNEQVTELKKKIDALSTEKHKLEINEVKLKKLSEQLGEKTEKEIERMRLQHEDEMEKLEEEYYQKLEAKQQQISQV